MSGSTDIYALCGVAVSGLLCIAHIASCLPSAIMNMYILLAHNLIKLMYIYISMYISIHISTYVCIS